MGDSWERRLVLGVRRDHLVAGTFLFVVAIAILLLSVQLVPELQSRLPESEATLYPNALAIVMARDDLAREHALLTATFDRVEAARAAVLSEIAALREQPHAVAAPEGGGTEVAAAGDRTAGADQIASLQTRSDGLTAQLESTAVHLARNAQLVVETEERYRRFGEESAAGRLLLTKLEAMPTPAGDPALGAPFTRPYNTLVLVLAVLMGALGGVISVAKAFVTPGTSSPQPADYFIRPIFGMVIAFVVFLLFKAGQPLITTDTSDDPLNPFPIALLGVVSGLMARQAIARLEDWGSRVFGEGTGEGTAAGEGVRTPWDAAVADTQAMLKAGASELDRIGEAQALLQEAEANADPVQRAGLTERLQETATASEQARQEADEIGRQAEIAAAAAERASAATAAADQAVALRDTERAREAAAAALKRLRAHADEVERIVNAVLTQTAEG